MELLNNDKALSYVGGAKFTMAVGIFIASAVSFILGVFDGFSNPKVCNNAKR